MAMLLGIDLGLRTGLTLYDVAGRLRWYRSRHLGTVSQLRRGVYTILVELPEPDWLALEGSNAYGDL